ncbi:MAG: type II toxin-antitoxin system RelE/ParE family toxin [Acidobacteriota bacterium]|nr:type II toxin-antitoxin system RelE/ParE family toxin [Acidobacteriota bacterium]
MTGHALHPEAYTDLDEIREHIAEDNTDAADRVITEIFDAIRALVAFPHQGYRRPNITSRPLRLWWRYSMDAAARASWLTILRGRED